MKSIRILRPLLLAIVILALGPRSLDAQVTLGRDEIDRISHAVVRVVALNAGQPVSSGSGTIVEPNGVIYTNRHVVQDGADFGIEILDDPNELPVLRFHARLVGYSPDVDFAILRIDRDAEGRPIDATTLDLPHVPVAEADVQRGDRVYVFGYPGIGEGYLALTEGAVTTIRNGTMDERRMPVWYQTDAQISPGNSGGLAVSARGEFVGIPTAVRTEETTGGRLGGILAISAVSAALEAGLLSDRAMIASGTTSPVIANGRLDYAQQPLYGAVSLTAGFTPDPHSLDVVSGGEVNVDYLGGECAGHAAMAPDYRLHWYDRSSQLRIFFKADDGGDTTLLVNLPDGSWVCNDDAADGTLDPMVVLAEPPEGQYDIWVGSYRAGSFVEGELNITELSLDPQSHGAPELDYTLGPYYGARALASGFLPDPERLEIVVGGGTVDASYLGGGCVGFTARQPELRLNWSGTSDELRIFFDSDDGTDTTLLVNLPDGSWVCNDDAVGTLDPMVVLPNPRAGQYDIWVGTYSADAFATGTLNITELDRGP